jgi:hypothetical protein
MCVIATRLEAMTVLPISEAFKAARGWRASLAASTRISRLIPSNQLGMSAAGDSVDSMRAPANLRSS